MTARPAALLLLLLLVATGCSPSAEEPRSAPTPSVTTSTPSPSPAPAPSEPTTPARKPPTPAVGSCYRLSYQQAVAPTARVQPTRCRDGHTAVTFHVGRLERVVDGRLLAVDAHRLQEQVSTTCPRLLPAYVGGTEEQRRLSMLRSVWFTPTLRQSDAGADWFRCDVVALARASQLLELAGSLSGVLDTAAGRDRFGMCGTAEPGTAGFERVACSLSHSWRALRTVGLPGPDYPGGGAVRQAGEGPCTASARAAAPDPLDFQWGYEFPTPDQWEAGQTYGICWAPL